MIRQHDISRWFSIRTITMLLIMVLFSVDVVRGYIYYAVSNHLKDTFVLLPFLQTNTFYMKAIELSILCFFSDAPFMEKNEMYYLMRYGKRRWGLHKYRYIVESSIAFAVVLFLVTILVTIPTIKFSNEWGELIRTVSVDNSIMGAFFSADAFILNRYSPLKLLLYVLSIDALAFVLIGMMTFVFSLIWGRKMGYILTIVVIYLPTIILRHVEGELVYFSPFSWLDMNFWRTGYDLNRPSMTYIVAVLLLLILLLGIIGIFQVQRLDWNVEEEI